jgi:hypothetical protein
MRYSCRAVVGHGQRCEPNYQCEACAAKQKYIHRIDKLVTALHEVVKINNQRDRFSADIDAIIINALGEEK